MFSAANIRIIGKDIVDAKLLLAAPRILAENRLMVGEMLNGIKSDLIAETPIGPGHFGYHLRDRYAPDVQSKGTNTTGVMKAPAQGYWREYGTRGRFKGPKSSKLRSYTAAIGGSGTGGEARLYLAHKAYASLRRLINAYYGDAQWWRL